MGRSEKGHHMVWSLGKQPGFGAGCLPQLVLAERITTWGRMLSSPHVCSHATSVPSGRRNMHGPPPAKSHAGPPTQSPHLHQTAPIDRAPHTSD